jgi:hypothetical protein
MDLAFESFDDELDILIWDTLNYLLDDVIAMLIFDKLKKVVVKLLHKLSLLVDLDVFYCLEKLVCIGNSSSNRPTFCTTR